MSEHHPISDYDAHAIELFLTTSGVRQQSGSGGAIVHLQTYGATALEARWQHAADNRALRRELAEAGHNVAAMPPDLLAATVNPGKGDEDAGRGYTEPTFEDEVLRAMVGRCRERMSARGHYGLWLVLETFFGETGKRFSDEPLPRAYALLHLVAPGRELLTATGKLLPASAGATAPDRMRRLCKLVDGKDYDPHRELFERGVIAADRLYREAAESWRSARQGGR